MRYAEWLVCGAAWGLSVANAHAANPQVLGRDGAVLERDAAGETQQGPAAEEAAPDGVVLSHRLGDGLQLRDPRGRFEFSLGNRIQARYTRAEPTGEPSASAFTVRRFKTFAKGTFYRSWLHFKVQVNWVGARSASGERLPELEDAFLDLELSPAVSVRAGQFKVPFNRQELTSSGAQQLVDRAVTNDRFAFDRDQGLMVHGEIWEGSSAQIEYSAAVLNAAGKNRAGQSSEPMAAVRVQWLPLGSVPYAESALGFSRAPRLALGAAFARRPAQRAGEGQPALARGTADAHFQWRGFSIASDLFLERPEGQRRRSTSGGMVQAGWFLLPGRLEIAGRYAAFHPPGGKNRREEARGGVNWFFSGHAWKLQVDAGAATGERTGAAALGDTEVRLQVQVIF